MTQTILVTGAAGFVGRSVVETALERGHHVLALDRAFDNQPIVGARCIEADMQDPEAVASAAQSADSVIHCAAIVGPKPANADPRRATEVNILGASSLLEAARATGLRVINLSTATLYGHRPNLEALDEDSPTDPVGVYDATKLMAEILCRTYRKAFGVRVASFRTGFVYGAGHSTGDYFIEALSRGAAALSDAGRDHPCDFTYVQDVALGLVQAAEADDLPEPVYNVTGGVLRTRGDLAAIALRHFPHASIDQTPGVDPGRHLRGVCIIERARRDFGYEPRFTLEDGVADWIARMARG